MPRALRDARAAEARFRVAFEAAPNVGIALAELSGGGFGLNDTMAQTFGARPAELVGRARLAVSAGGA